MMSLFVTFALVLGVLSGMLWIPESGGDAVDRLSSVCLYALVFLIGIEVAFSKNTFKIIKNIGKSVLLTVAGTILGTAAGGLIMGFLLPFQMREVMSVAMGFGWYSFSAVILKEMAGAKVAALAFLTNIAREITAFILIPFIAKYINQISAVPPGGATSMDTTLTVVKRSCDEETVLISFAHGFLLTAVVPLLVPLVFNIFNF